MVGRLRDDVARVERHLPLVVKIGAPVAAVGLGTAWLARWAVLSSAPISCPPAAAACAPADLGHVGDQVMRLAGLGSVVLLLTIWGLLTFFVGRRTRRLTAVVSRVAAGDLSARVFGGAAASCDPVLDASGELNRMLDGLQESQHQMRSILDTANDAYVGMSSTGLVDEWNDAAGRVFGWSRHEALGQDLAELIVPPELRPAHNQGLRNFQAHGHGPLLGRTIEISALHRDGHRFPAELTVWESWARGERRFNSFIRDITERKRLESELTHRALHDSLTGLSNRTLFGDRLEHALQRRATGHVAVLFLDLDDFKTVNDSLGHSVGDQLLVAVATRFAAVLRPSDTLARLAGDEFALLAEDISGVSDAEDIAARLLATLREPFVVAGRETFTHASIGIALHDSADSDAEGLLRNADVAMYTAKRSSKSGYAVFEQQMHDAAVQRLELKADLERALQRDELRVHYQPFIELSSGEVIGFEALVRWQHPQRGLLLPLTFIPLAEETGFVRAIDRWVLAEAARQSAWWQADRPGSLPLTMSVNISARGLQDPSFVDDVADVLARTGLLPSTLVLEVTESALTEDVEAAAERLQQLRALGVRIAIDDFGTGYSSLSHLARFPIDTFKIDKSFVDSIVTDPESPMAQAIVEIGRTLRLQTVAEGVESPAQLERLRSLGCHVAQGFLFAEPLPPEEATALLPRLDSRADPSGGADGHLALPV
ncbi:MAG: putative bifunctional diguanylate cyclase/phosphodiesterase [Actinomycetes bacterium]